MNRGPRPAGDCPVESGRIAPPIVGSCITCGACNHICPSQANPFDLINDRQEETGALGVPEEALERFTRLHELATHVEKGEPGKPVVNLCIVRAMVREQLRGPLFKGLTIVEGADYFCGAGCIHLENLVLRQNRHSPSSKTSRI